MTQPAGALIRSQRDPAAVVLEADGRILRAVREQELPRLLAFLETPVARSAVDAGRLIATRPLEGDELGAFRTRLSPWLPDGFDGAFGVLEHERVPFFSYPHEWPPAMLHDAARLTLDLAEDALMQGDGLKDATPYNVAFRGASPVFVDIASFEPREARDSTWLPYAQFARTFLLPLAAYRLLGVEPADLFLPHREGLSPEDFTRMVPLHRRLLPPLLQLATVPSWLGQTRRAAEVAYTPRLETDPKRARYILRAVFRQLRGALETVAPPVDRRSTWSEYAHGANSYSAAQMAAKQAFVQTTLAAHRPETVLDVGANTGTFSAIAAVEGARVVAIDSDPGVLGPLAARARAERLDILPLHVDLARPTPAVGWRNAESDAFVDRAAGAFDVVLMLAVVHHLVVTEGIPLPEVLDLAAALARDIVVIEYVAPQDAMFRRIARGRDALYAHLTREHFEVVAGRHFTIERVEQLPDAARWLYVLRPRAPRPS